MEQFQTDPFVTAAARALAAGDPIRALNFVALRNDAPALALRGIALAQVGDLPGATTLLRRAARVFGPKAPLPRARCILAEAEISLVSRNLSRLDKRLAEARATLEEHGDFVNAAHARMLEVRRLVLLGRLKAVEPALAEINTAVLPPALRATHQLIAATVAIRRLQTATARVALACAERAARASRIPALLAEVGEVKRTLVTAAARLIRSGEERLLLVEEVETLLASGALVVDACHHVIRKSETIVSLARRPVLFALARALAEAWPADSPRSTLIKQAFQVTRINDSHRARLRVEIGRLRNKIKTLADVSATSRGFVLKPRPPVEVALLSWAAEQEHADLLAFLADGESWSSSALSMALGASQRTVQRALDSLAAAGKVRAVGGGRARRWMTPPVPGFTTVLLLPRSLPMD